MNLRMTKLWIQYYNCITYMYVTVLSNSINLYLVLTIFVLGMVNVRNIHNRYAAKVIPILYIGVPVFELSLKPCFYTFAESIVEPSA